MTIKEIAKIAGVSPSTISKIMNNKDNNIKKETRERVLKVIKEYNYIPYSSTNNIVLSSNRTIGVILNNNYHILEGIINTAQENHYTVIVYNSNNNLEQELKNITSLISYGASGIIWEPINKESLVYSTYFKEKNISYITIGSYNTNSIKIPYEKLGHTLTKELISYGHKNIACILDSSNNDFLIGYKKCLFENNLEFKKEFIFQNIDKQVITKIKNYNITGVISENYYKALTFYRNMSLLHYDIPKECSIVSLKNDSDPIIESFISTYTVSLYDFGKHLCEKIISMLEKNIKIDFFLKNNIKLANRNTITSPSNSSNKKIVVIGSINIDTYLYFSQLPNPKQKINTTSKYYISAGGKGINQSIGISKLGEKVSLIGSVGDDTDSDTIYNILNIHNVEISGVKREHNTKTGKAYIFVDKKGESIISLLSGANSSLLSKNIIDNEYSFKSADYCLIQSEIPLETIIEACKMAHKYNTKIIFKPSAISYFPEELYSFIDIIIPNKNELNELFPQNISINEKAQKLLDLGVKIVIVTLGKNGCYVKTKNYEKTFPALKLKEIIDSTGASDAFISALVSYLINDYNLEKSIKIAMYAASFSLTQKGVISSLVDKETLENYIRIKEPTLLKK